jgi:alkanesulfonate monooxygenase SsuD/methylene tetrahydromethanopterin reductase-like flavin-dependent oxidoreductase (luciferase family)
MASYDALAVASAVGRAVPRISVGTTVVPIYPRHPQILASAARTAQAATGGRFQLKSTTPGDAASTISGHAAERREAGDGR